MNYIKKYTIIIYLVFFLILCFLMYFINMGGYAFVDTDETKYASIAKDMLNRNDWINTYLNGQKWLETPPLLFWLINISCLIFGKISLEAVRMPISITASLGVICLFLAVRSILTKKYAFIISLIFATNLGIIIFSRLATNDLLYSTTTMLAILFSCLILFNKTEKTKYIYWCLVYLFCGFAILTAGLFGLLVPFFAILIIYIFSGNLKELFKFKNILTGVLILSILTLPWYIIMIHKYGLQFIKEIIVNYNIIKYVSGKNILNTISIFLIGFLPWSFSFLWIIGSRIKHITNTIISYFKENSQDKLNEKWKKLSRTEKFLSINTIIFFTGLTFTLIYGAKFTYLILFLMYPSSCIAGIYWYDYLIRKRHDRSIFFATLIPNLILIICSLTGLFGHNYLNKIITQDLGSLMIPLIIVFFAIPVFGIFAVILRGRKSAFISNIILMISLTFIITPSVYNFIITSGGESDLIAFSTLANRDKVQLAGFIPSKKYSITYYYDNIVEFQEDNDTKWLKQYLTDNPRAYVITEIKDLWEIQHMPYDIVKQQKKETPEVIVY